MNVEDRLRDAVQSTAADVTPVDENWSTIEARAAAARRTRVVRRGGFGVLAVAAAVALVFGVVQVLDRDDRQKIQVTGPDPTTAPAGPTAPANAVWARSADTPEEAAQQFATEYLHMTSPSVGSFANGSVPVRPKPNAGPTTKVAVEQTADGKWWVVGAASDNLRLSSPTPGASITSPFTMSGESTSFEGHVNVEVRGYDPGPRPIGHTYYTGGGNGEFAPFAAAVVFDYASNVDRGSVTLIVNSAEDGSVSEGTVVPVRFGSPRLGRNDERYPADRVELKTNASVVRYHDDKQAASVEVYAPGSYVVSVAAAPGGRAWVERSDNQGCSREIVDTAELIKPFPGGEPEVSFDGKYLAYTRSSAGDTCKHDTIVVRDVASGKERTWLLPNPVRIRMSVSRLAWSPSNRYIAFTIAMSDSSRIRVLDLDVHRDLAAATEVLNPSVQALPKIAFAGTTLVIQTASGPIVTAGMGTTLAESPTSTFSRIDFDASGQYLLAVLSNNGLYLYRPATACCSPPDPGDTVDADW